MAGAAQFFSGAAVLTAAVALSKVLGALYKIPLGNLLGSTGMAHFYAAYNIFNLLLLLSTAGLSVAVSRLTSTAEVQGRCGQMRRILRTALLLFTAIGLVGSAVMLLFPQVLANLLHDAPAAAAIRVLAPSVLCICVVCAVRGYTQGLGNMRPTAVSQILESAVKLTVGLFLCRYLLQRNAAPHVAAAGAIAGVTAGSVLSLCYMLRTLRHCPLPPAFDTPLSRRATARQILSIGIPITLGSAGMSLITLLDQSLTLGTLQHTLGYTAQDASALYGQYTFALTLFTLPCSFIYPVSAALMPALAGASARRDTRAAVSLTDSALRLTALLSFPMGLGMSVLAEPLLLLLYPAVPETARAAAAHLKILGLASIFVCLMAVTSGILQACGKERLPLVTLLCGGALKILTNYLMVSQPEIHIGGAAVSTLYCYALITLLNIIAVGRTVASVDFFRLFWRPGLAAVLMAMAAGSGYRFLQGRLPDTPAVLLTVLAAAAVYAALALALGAVTPAELRCLLPQRKTASCRTSRPHGSSLR